MTIQQLEYILAVYHHKHFLNAAEECGISQPTLSAMIQKLEEELGVKIFDRTKHPIEPTEIGLKIILQAKTTINEMSRVKEIVDSEISSLSGSLKIGILTTVAPYLVPKFISHFTKDYNNVELSVLEMRNSALITSLLSSSIDMAILTTPTNNDSLFEIPLYHEKFIAYMSPDCKYREKELKANDMPEENLWVLQEGQCIIKGQKFKFCTSDIANNIYAAGSIDTLVRIVDENGGYTVIPELHRKFLSEEQQKNIREIVSPVTKREISLVIRQDYIKERMLNSVADTIKQIIPQDMIDDRLKKFSIKL
jgi:LysR family hydrogen peroxide-inducible transcriptional activator